MPTKGKVIRLEDIPWRRNYDPRDWLNYKRLLWEETGSKELCVGLGELPPGRVLGLHHHVGDAEFYYMLSGRARVTVDDVEVDATPGTAIYIPPSAKHSIVNDGSESFVMIYGLNAPTRRFVWDEPFSESTAPRIRARRLVSLLLWINALSLGMSFFLLSPSARTFRIGNMWWMLERYIMEMLGALGEVV